MDNAATARKRFGQHFLIDQAVIARIVDAIAPSDDATIIEIGPGKGALTRPLLKRHPMLTAIEIDRDLIAELQALTATFPDFNVISADVLTVDFKTLQRDARLLKVYGNLPYNISTPLLFHLLRYAAQISEMVFMVQKEVALRLVAEPNTKAYGRLSVMMQYYCKVDYLFTVPAAAFDPPPRVESSIIRVIPHRVLPAVANDPATFAELVKLAFGQRRKVLRNSLQLLISDEKWASLPISPRARGENLSVSDFVMLSNAIL